MLIDASARLAMRLAVVLTSIVGGGGEGGSFGGEAGGFGDGGGEGGGGEGEGGGGEGEGGGGEGGTGDPLMTNSCVAER